MRITSSIEYATRLMVQLGRAHCGSSPERQALSAEKLSRAENVPPDYVNQILLRLKRAGLVESRRGSAGGYALRRPPSQVRLGDVARAVEGRIFEDVCERYTGKSDCRHQAGCAISPVWQKLGAMIERYFDSVTLDALLDEKPAECGRVVALFERMPH